MEEGKKEGRREGKKGGEKGGREGRREGRREEGRKRGRGDGGYYICICMYLQLKDQGMSTNNKQRGLSIYLLPGQALRLCPKSSPTLHLSES